MGSSHIALRRHGLPHVEIYEITDDELERIEREGSDVGFDFQVAQFCLTIAFSFFAGLVLSPPPDSKPKIFIVFVIIVVVGLILGVVFGIKWVRGRGAFSRTIGKIRERQIEPVASKHEPAVIERSLPDPKPPSSAIEAPGETEED